MPTLNNRNFTGLGGINLRESNGAVRFETPLITPTTTSGERLLYVNSSNELVYNNGSSAVVVGASAGGGTPSWETMFASDATFTMTPDNTFTIAGNRATATDVVTMTNIAGGSGAILQFTNSTDTNKDIDGTASAWSILGTGVASFAGLTFTGANTITSTVGDITWTLEDNDATALAIGSSGATSIMTFVTTNAAESVNFGNAMQVTDGIATFISTSNTVSNVLVTNNTITTFGASASSAGAVCIRSTSLTTGALLQLQLSDTSNAGGFYLSCRESVGGTNDFTVGENGVVVALGTAASNSFTLSNGDVLMSDGSITLTDADDAASFSLTNNTATTASVVAIAGSGVHTGTTTTSFMTITPSGMTSGTALYIPVAGMTSGTGISVVAATATFTTGGKLLNLDSTAAVAGNLISAVTTGAYTGTGMLIMSAGAMTTGIMISLTSTTGLTSGSLLRLTSSTAGAIATNGAVSIRATGAFTSTSNVGYVDVLASATTAGTVMRVASSAAGQTATELLRVVASGFTTGYTGNVAYFESSSTTGAANVVAISSANSTAGNALSVTANSLTTGVGVLVTSSGTITSAGEGLVNIVGTGITTGDALKIDLTEVTLTTGHYINCYDDTGASSVFSVGENGVVLFSDFTEVVTAVNTITAAESGSVFFLNSATEFVSTLPAVQAGLHFTFIVTAAPSGASYTVVTAASSNVMLGTVHSSDGVDGDSELTGGDTLSFVDGAAVVGDRAEFWCDGTNWFGIAHCNVSTGITYTTAT